MVKMINRPTEKKYCLYLNHEELFMLITLLGLISPSMTDNILNSSSKIDKYFSSDKCLDMIDENIWRVYKQISNFMGKNINADRSISISINDIYYYMRDNNLINFDFKKGDNSNE